MSKVKIQGNASGTGVLTVEAPNTSTDRTVTLPDATGTLVNTAPSTSGNILTSDGTNWTSAAPAAGGLYASVAIICDEKSSGTEGGTFTNGAWRTRDLNTEISDSDGIVSIASNQFTLQAGTYTIEWVSPSYKVSRNKSKLRNITDASDVEYSGIAICSNAYSAQANSIGYAQTTISGAKAFEIQHYCQDTSSSTGFGTAGGTDTGTVVEIYTIVKILKHS